MVYLLVSLVASVIGAICGIGGGVIIKPLLDFLHTDSVSTISFMSSVTVLCMSAYSVIRNLLERDTKINLNWSTPLAGGSVLGGILGKACFLRIAALFVSTETIGKIQAACLAFLTLMTLLYTLRKRNVRTLNIVSKTLSSVIGLFLGLISSFLGIGGGPINLMVLSWCFGMDSKTAAASSLYIILFSQAANLIYSVLTAAVPTFAWNSLLLMGTGGIVGGIIGRSLNRRMSCQSVDTLFVALMLLIVGICIYNTFSSAI